MLVPGRVWGRTRASMTGAVLWSAALVLLLTLMVSRSTATAAWVAGIDVVTFVALGGALLMGVLAITPVPWAAGLGAGFVAGPVVAAVAAWPMLHNAHPGDPMSIYAVGTWWTRIVAGAAAGDPPGYALSSDTSVYLYLICLLMWVTGGWLSWCVLRWRRPMLGLVPGAAAFATNLLNTYDPADQNAYTLAILVLTLALLLWTNYTASIANAARARVKLTGDARWDFWESGLVVMAALIVLAIILPPLSTVDRTVQMQATAFSSWAQLQEKLSHPNNLSQGGTGGGKTGFSTEVKLGGPLARTRNIVFTYTYSASSGTIYFRGVNETETTAGEWDYPSHIGMKTPIIQKLTIPPYSESYQEQAFTPFKVTMVTPPTGYNTILFYPGTLYKIDRDTMANEAVLPANQSLTTIDSLMSVSPPVSNGTYNVTVEYSTATEAELKQAGTDYPDWLATYSSLPPDGYRDPHVIDRVHQLALTITAGAATPYDKAKAIEAYLRDTNNYTYTLTPQATPPDRDPLDFFLFSSKRGYCQFFATAMGDMLRSLGIPTRLVNGFGPGQYDNNFKSYVVRDEDAHTWVEAYFPTYGWITFEPTPQTGYSTVSRGSPGTNVCLRDSQCDTTPGVSPTPGVLPPGFREPNGGPNGNTGGVLPGASGFTFRMPDAVTLSKIVGIVLAVLLVLLAGVARYLRPRSVMLVWKRTLVLARLAGAERRMGETPLELGRRLANAFPEAAEPVRSLADGFVVSAYAPPDLAGTARASVMEAWVALRPLLLRRVASRLRPSRAWA